MTASQTTAMLGHPAGVGEGQRRKGRLRLTDEAQRVAEPRIMQGLVALNVPVHLDGRHQRTETVQRGSVELVEDEKSAVVAIRRAQSA